jgi:hypothetical protein
MSKSFTSWGAIHERHVRVLAGRGPHTELDPKDDARVEVKDYSISQVRIGRVLAWDLQKDLQRQRRILVGIAGRR